MKRSIIGLLLLVLLLAACDAGTTGSGGDVASRTPAVGGAASPTPEGGAAPTSDGSIILPGDGEEDVVGDPEDGFETGTQGMGFLALVTGSAFNGEIAGDGYFACENNRYAIRSDSSNFPQVTLILPADVTPGTYSFGDMDTDPDVVAAMIVLEDNSVFAGSVLGTLILNTVADTPGEIVSGSYDFTASNGQSTLAAEGSFEFRSSEGVTYCS